MSHPNKGKKRVKNVLTGRYTYVRREKQLHGLYALIVSIILCLLFLFYNQVDEGLESPLGIVEADTTIPTPTKEPDYIPSERTLKVIENNPGMTGKISRFYGKEWRQYAELIARESSFNQYAINPTSGACGLAQALPCEKPKFDCELSDVDCQLNWIKEYVERRYGSIDKALYHHDVMNWY